jgi:hypothetical protein
MSAPTDRQGRFHELDCCRDPDVQNPDLFCCYQQSMTEAPNLGAKARAELPQFSPLRIYLFDATAAWDWPLECLLAASFQKLQT